MVLLVSALDRAVVRAGRWNRYRLAEGDPNGRCPLIRRVSGQDWVPGRCCDGSCNGLTVRWRLTVWSPRAVRSGGFAIIPCVTVLLVAVGGVAGVLARYGLGTTVSGDGVPWMIFAINVSGSFVLGAMLPWTDQLSDPVRNGLAIGFCGGFTTFSTISVQVFADTRDGNAGFALFYLAATIVCGLLGAALGYYASRAVAS